MSNLLKEAIADAKAVRATALANAKAALEEAFQPKLEAMLAEKLKNEISDSDFGGLFATIQLIEVGKYIFKMNIRFMKKPVANYLRPYS